MSINPNSLANLRPPWAPGESPRAGRKTAGQSVREWVNLLREQGFTTNQLRAIAKNDDEPWDKQIAAGRMVIAAERGDMADMEPLLKGEVGLVGLRENGVNTEVIKRYKVKTRILKQEGLPVGEEIDREVELYDRGGENFDRVVDTTAGKPDQNLKITAKTPVEHMTDEELLQALEDAGLPPPPGLMRKALPPAPPGP